MSAHAEEQRIHRAEYYRTNGDALRERKRRRYRRDPQKNLQRAAEWRARNPDKARLFDKKGLAKRRALMRSADGHFSIADIRALEVAQEGLCAYCQRPYGRYHVEHKQPLSRGGSNWPDNICLACGPCNIAKHDRTEAEYRTWLSLAGR
jgi:5-methylcytosine-specific restriction endonuclease McrA